MSNFVITGSAGKIRMVPKGVHDSTLTYDILDLVSNEDHTRYFISKQRVPVNIPLTNTDYWDEVIGVDGIDNKLSDLKSVFDDLATATADEIPVPFTDEISPVYTLGYMNMNGTTVFSTAYYYTNKIPVKVGDVIKAGPNKNASMRVVTAYTGETAITSSGKENVTSYTVPEGIDGIVITGNTSFVQEDYKLYNSTTKEAYGQKVDDTLTIVGTAADAQAVGSKFDSIDVVLDSTSLTHDIFDIPDYISGYMYPNGSTVPSTGYKYTRKIPVKFGDLIKRVDNGSLRTVTAFSGDTPITEKGKDTAVVSYIVPFGIDGVVLTLTSSYSSYIVVTRNSIENYNSRLSVVENPFRHKRFIGHLGVSQYDNIIIPSQSIFDVSRTKRLGFDVIELNIQNTSDGKYVCLHGVNGRFGPQFTGVNGEDVSNTLISSLTLAEIKERIRYVSKYDKYKTAPFSIEEILRECKKQNIIPALQVTKETISVLDVVNRLIGENNYITLVYNTPTRVNQGVSIGWLTITDPSEMITRCKTVGKPYIAGINASDPSYSTFTKDDWITLSDAVHQAGFFITFVDGYVTPEMTDTLFNSGFDGAITLTSINEIEYGNLLNLYADTDFSDFTHTGTVSDAVLTLGNSDTLAPSGLNDAVFLGGASLHIRFNGTLRFNFGRKTFNITNAGETDTWLSTYFEEAVPTFTATSIGETKVFEVSYKASKM